MNRAQRALDCVQSRPDDAVRWSQELLADPDATPAEQVTATWAMGRVHAETGHLDQALETLERGIELAGHNGLTVLEADIRLSLATCLLLTGDTAAAHHQLELAEPHLDLPGSRGRLVMQRGFLAMHQGAMAEAADWFDEAEPMLAGGADELGHVRLLLNRGIANTMRGLVAQGEADFARALDLANGLGQQMLAAGATQNLGFAASRRGDLPAALRWFDDARERYRALGSPPRLMGTLEIDTCNVLLPGGLYADAAAAAGRAVALATATGNRLDEAEARLLAARAHLAGGELAEGEREAEAAAALFRESERAPWVALAEHVSLTAAARRSPPSEPLLQRAVASAEHLTASGWRREALEVRTFAGRTALALGRVDEARALLAPLADEVAEGSAALRATAWLATATLRLADGDRAAAKAALSAGMAVVEEHRATLGSTELRAHVSINAAELAELGLQLATEDGDPLETLAWAERWHAGALSVAPVRPAPDSPLARALTELREVHVSVTRGTADPFDDVDPDRRIAALERRIRDLSRSVAGGGAPPAVGRAPTDADLPALRRSLGSGVLVEYFSVGGDLHAVVVEGGSDGPGVRLHCLGRLDDVDDAVRRIAATLARLAYGQGSDSALRATADALDAMAAALDERLVAKLGLPPRVDVVVVPTGSLQGLPWPALPSLAHRTVTVSPSGCLWVGTGSPSPDLMSSGVTGDGLGQQFEGSPDLMLSGVIGDGLGQQFEGSTGRALLVCGAGLPGGVGEIERLRRIHAGATVLTGEQATVPAVTRAMAEADLVHLAAHGSFRADNPMFSALGLHDGPLTVYDLESLSRAPTTVILPACDAGRASVRHGDELLGTAAALLQVGVRTVIAPVTVVPDARVVPPLMEELHRLIRAGVAPATALVRARQHLARTLDDVQAATAASFVAIGRC
ncbi:MAG: CHAT domain-containing protein [Acidimicrobiales bacterium]